MALIIVGAQNMQNQVESYVCRTATSTCL